MYYFSKILRACAINVRARKFYAPIYVDTFQKIHSSDVKYARSRVSRVTHSPKIHAFIKTMKNTSLSLVLSLGNAKERMKKHLQSVCSSIVSKGVERSMWRIKDESLCFLLIILLVICDVVIFCYFLLMPAN